MATAGHIVILLQRHHAYPDPVKHINIGRDISVVYINIEFERVIGIDYFGEMSEKLRFGELSCKL